MPNPLSFIGDAIKGRLHARVQPYRDYQNKQSDRDLLAKALAGSDEAVSGFGAELAGIDPTAQPTGELSQLLATYAQTYGSQLDIPYGDFKTTGGLNQAADIRSSTRKNITKLRDNAFTRALGVKASGEKAEKGTKEYLIRTAARKGKGGGKVYDSPEGQIVLPAEDLERPKNVPPNFEQSAGELIQKYPDAAWMLDETGLAFSPEGKQVIAEAKGRYRNKGLGINEAVTTAVMDATEARAGGAGGEQPPTDPGGPEGEGLTANLPEQTINDLSDVAARMKSGELQVEPEEVAKRIASREKNMSAEEILAILEEFMAVEEAPPLNVILGSVPRT